MAEAKLLTPGVSYPITLRATPDADGEGAHLRGVVMFSADLGLPDGTSFTASGLSVENALNRLQRIINANVDHEYVDPPTEEDPAT